jgi:hypothetical protein
MLHPKISETSSGLAGRKAAIVIGFPLLPFPGTVYENGSAQQPAAAWVAFLPDSRAATVSSFSMEEKR